MPNLILRVVLVVAVTIGAKLLFHSLGWEILSLNPLFSGIVAANVFVMGFLLIGVIGFLLTFLLLLIHDLDNPFGYYEAGSSNEDVSLKPLENVVARLDRRLNEPRPQAGSTG